MSRDVLLYGLSESLPQAALIDWMHQTPEIGAIVPDYHRLQIEHWVWSKRNDLGARVMDVGNAERPRNYISPGYFTLDLLESDVRGSLLALPVATRSLDGVICTEVLEHCADPFQACRELHRVLKPSGLLLASSPFLWPDHRRDEYPAYPDFWRFTEQGWELLLRGFASVQLKACAFTTEGEFLYDLMRRFECFGFRTLTKITSGYLVEAVA